MDPRHPTIAFVANLVGLVALVSLFFSLLLPFFTPKGWGLAETILLIVAITSVITVYWAKREHEIMIVHEHGGSESQYMQLEELPTMVSLNDEASFVNSNTAAVIESIVGTQTSQSKNQVEGAIDVLSTGEIGKTSAEAVSINQVQHTQVNLPQSNVELPKIETRSIPLPSISVPEVPMDDSVSAMIDLDDLMEDDTNSKPQSNLPDLPEF